MVVRAWPHLGMHVPVRIEFAAATSCPDALLTFRGWLPEFYLFREVSDVRNNRHEHYNDQTTDRALLFLIRLPYRICINFVFKDLCGPFLGYE